MQLLYEYTQNFEYLTTLATRVLQAQARLAQQGYRTGGHAPYGFVRVLVDARMNVIQELPPGTTIRREGCHVALQPKEWDKIAVWHQILKLYGQYGWGLQRICNHLNQLGIPSPGAVTFRRVNGQPTAVSGRWSQRTVARLIDDSDIIGMAEYGKRSTGSHRRVGEDGPRTLTDEDRDGDQKAKARINRDERVIRTPVRDVDASDKELFAGCQRLREKRSKNRRGVTRCPDPARYPLALRVHDLSPGCGKPLYGRKAKDRPVYLCSRYMRSGAQECHHNAVDAEAALAFVLDALRQRAVMAGGRAALRERLLQISRSTEKPVRPEVNELELAEQYLKAQEAELLIIRGNMAKAKTDETREAMEAEFEKKNAEVKQLRVKTERLQVRAAVHPPTDPEREVEAALQLFDAIDKITSDPAARAEIPAVLKALDVNVWLRFGERSLSGTRTARVVESGILTIGSGATPVPGLLDGDGAQPRGGVCGGGGMEPSPAATTPAIGSERHRESGGFTIGTHGEPWATGITPARGSPHLFRDSPCDCFAALSSWPRCSRCSSSACGTVFVSSVAGRTVTR